MLEILPSENSLRRCTLHILYRTQECRSSQHNTNGEKAVSEEKRLVKQKAQDDSIRKQFVIPGAWIFCLIMCIIGGVQIQMFIRILRKER